MNIVSFFFSCMYIVLVLDCQWWWPTSTAAIVIDVFMYIRKGTIICLQYIYFTSKLLCASFHPNYEQEMSFCDY